MIELIKNNSIEQEIKFTYGGTEFEFSVWVKYLDRDTLQEYNHSLLKALKAQQDESDDADELVMAHEHYVESLVPKYITEWSVVDVNGDTPPCTEQNVAELMQHAIANTMLKRAFVQTQNQQMDEHSKNLSSTPDIG